jgi:hypothetical protein
MTTLAQMIVECRSIPRTARVRQGFPRLNDFARHVHRLRDERIGRHAPNPTPADMSRERLTILAGLTRIIEDDAGLRLAARRAAVDWSYSGYSPLGRGWTPPIELVWTVPWRETDQRRYQGLPITTPRIIGDRGHGWWHRYQRSTRRIAVPVAWLLARLRERAGDEATSNPSSIVRATLARERQMREQREMLRRAAMVRRAAAQPDPHAPDTLGWRIWHWDAERQLLCSPQQGTLWYSAELRVERWDESSVLRGVAGIHARRMPRNWLQAEWGDHDLAATYPNCLSGVVERFGNYVLGTSGWRAEWVVIRKLRAPTSEVGLALETAYPEVEIVYEDR